MSTIRAIATGIVLVACLVGALYTVDDERPRAAAPRPAPAGDLRPPGRPAAPPAVKPVPTLPAASARSVGTRPAAVRAARTFDALPLRFEANAGQTDPSALFIARGRRSTLFLTSSGAVMSVAGTDGRQRAVRMSFVGAGDTPRVAGERELPGRTHYLVGPESGWRRDVVGYAGVRYEQMYSGVDVVFYGRDRELEFDVVVAPGADPEQVGIEIAGADDVHLDEAGDLILSLDAGPIRLARPVAYQERDGIRRPIDAAFELSGDRVGFRVGAYDESRPLVIDPVILYATFLGGNWDDSVRGVGVDAAGNVYVAGFTSSSDFPLVAPFDNRWNSVGVSDPFDPRPNDAFVAKLAPDGSALIYATYLGGGRLDEAFGLAVDGAGHAYVTGRTLSPDFPRTAGAYDATPNGGTDAFLMKLVPDGSALAYSTVFGTGGHDHALDTAADNAGIAYVLGHAADASLPLTPDAYYTGAPFGGSFLARFDTTASGPASLQYSTFTGIVDTNSFGGRMDVTPEGDVVITGHFLEVTPVNGFQTSQTPEPQFGFPSTDAAILRVNPRAADPSQAIVYGSYIGGSSTDMSTGVGAGANGLVCVVGHAASADYPVRNAFQPVLSGQRDAFVSVFDTTKAGDASLVYSTFLGGFQGDEATLCDFDRAGVLHVAGRTSSATDFPLRAPFQATMGGSSDVFVSTLDPSASGTGSLTTASFYGGSVGEFPYAMAFDGAGGIWVGGITNSADLPLSGAIQTTLRFRDDGFLARFGETGGGGSGGGGGPQMTATAIAPSRGGTGHVTAVVHGAGFQDGASVKLVRGSEQVPGDPVKFIDSSALQVVLDLSGRSSGAWDVVVTNPDNTTATLAGAFTVEPVTAFIRASVSIVMNPTMRLGRPAAGYITYSNPTNVDVMLPIFIYVPYGKTLDFGIPIRHGPSISDPPVDFSQMPDVFDTGTEQVIPLIVNVPPGHTGVIPISIREGCDPLQPTPIRVQIGTPRSRTESMTCATALIGLVLDAFPLTDCLSDILGLLNTAVGSYTGEPATLGSWITDILIAAVKCTAAAVPVAAALKIAIEVTEIIAFADDTIGALESCSGGLRPGGPSYVAADRSCVRSADPNAKYGPAGAGDSRHVTGADPMTYVVAFENLATASGAAQDVVVTDTLDAGALDLDTFVLGPISFGGRTVVPPPGLSEYVTSVDLRPAVNLLLKIDARLDRATSVATWRFTSLDPATGQPTTDPIAGFLPPNVRPPEGEGTVMFTAVPVASLATDDVIRNAASIVFDTNAPIDTGEWTNAIDKASPTSSVTPLLSPQWSPSFVVDWSGGDIGSGVADYTVYASANGGPYAPWLTGTTVTSATFTGAVGNTYRFFSLARDKVGNQEAMKSVAEAVVDVDLECDIDGDLDVDRNDTNLIMAGRTATAAPRDPRDPNRDGAINILDARYCTLRCTRASCAP